MLALTTILLLLSSSWCLAGALDTVVDFIRQVAKESDTSVLRIRHDHCPEDWLQELLVESPCPMLLQSLNISFDQRISRPLQIICLSSGFKTSLLEQLKRRERSILYLQGSNSNELLSLLRSCHQLKMQKILVLQVDGKQQMLQHFYSYSPQPHFEVEQHGIESFSGFFGKRLSQYPNMQRRPLIVMPDQGHPRSMVYVDPHTGKLILGGSVGRFIGLLSWKLNATMKFAPAMKPGQTLHPNEVIQLVQKYPIDIPVSVILATQLEHIISYPFELTHICLMIPLAQQVPLGEIFRLLTSAQNVFIALAIVYGFGLFLSFHQYLKDEKRIVCLSDFLLNDRALRGLLGQSFKLTSTNCKSLGIKAIYFTLSIIGLNLSCIYEAALGTMLTHPPKYFQPRNVADLQRAGLRMGITDADIDMGKEMHLPLHIVNVSEFHHLRDTLNISHVYFSSRLHWTIFSQQQKYFANELFLYSMDACFSTLTLIAIPLAEDSWFLEPISRLTFEIRSYGLYQYYVSMHFSDMTAAGLVIFKDLSQGQRSEKRKGVPLNLNDLKWISYAYVFLILLAIIVFAIEIIVWKCFKK